MVGVSQNCIEHSSHQFPAPVSCLSLFRENVMTSKKFLISFVLLQNFIALSNFSNARSYKMVKLLLLEVAGFQWEIYFCVRAGILLLPTAVY